MTQPDAGRRRSIRLKGFDYTQRGAYFITLVARAREDLFGAVIADEVRLNAWGQLIRDEWLRLTTLRPALELDAFVLMPNHLHGILVIAKPPAATQPVVDQPAHEPPASSPPRGTQSGSVAAIVQQFKSETTRKINLLRRMPGAALWQRNYYEHIVRNDDDLNRIRQYIADNPGQWASDRENLHPTPPPYP